MLRALISLLGTETDAENQFIQLAALGTIVSAYPSLIATAKPALSAVLSGCASSSTDKVKAIAKELEALFGK